MSIITYKTDNGEVYKDTNIYDPYKTYLTNGQGCGTIWFKNVSAAKKALIADGCKTGRDFGVCDQCQFHYSFADKANWNKYPPHVCTDKKDEYAKKFENGSN